MDVALNRHSPSAGEKLKLPMVSHFMLRNKFKYGSQMAASALVILLYDIPGIHVKMIRIKHKNVYKEIREEIMRNVTAISYSC